MLRCHAEVCAARDAAGAPPSATLAGSGCAARSHRGLGSQLIRLSRITGARTSATCSSFSGRAAASAVSNESGAAGAAAAACCGCVRRCPRPRTGTSTCSRAFRDAIRCTTARMCHPRRAHRRRCREPWRTAVTTSPGASASRAAACLRPWLLRALALFAYGMLCRGCTRLRRQ